MKPRCMHVSLLPRKESRYEYVHTSIIWMDLIKESQNISNVLKSYTQECRGFTYQGTWYL